MKKTAVLLLLLLLPGSAFAQGEGEEEPIQMRPNPDEFRYRDQLPEDELRAKTDSLLGHEVTHVLQNNQPSVESGKRGQLIGIEQEGLTEEQIQAVKKAQMKAIGQSAQPN